MKKTINIKNEDDAIAILFQFKNKRYKVVDVKFENVHLLKINELIRKEIFRKNDLYVNSDTLYEIMQPIGGRGTHNHHGLTPKEILDVLNNLTNPFCIYESKTNRYGIISMVKRITGETFIIIVEVGSGLIGKIDANINKFVTMYPKNDIGKLLEKVKKILYLQM